MFQTIQLKKRIEKLQLQPFNKKSKKTNIHQSPPFLHDYLYQASLVLWGTFNKSVLNKNLNGKNLTKLFLEITIKKQRAASTALVEPPRTLQPTN